VQRNSQCAVVLSEINPNLDDDFFLESLQLSVKVSATETGTRRGNLTAERLAKNW
jgi:hypothetical protein